MDAMADGAKFPPVVVFYDGAIYWLADGFHRVKAAEQAGTHEIACDLRQGTQQDAQWYSFGANKTNGLRRTNDDKHRAVKAALGHPNGAQLSNRQIAAHVGVDEGTVRNWREKLTAEIPQSPKRRGRDGRNIKVTKIGKTASQPKPAPEPEVAPRAEPVDFTCATCGEVFPAPVWHCDTCGHHWPSGQTQCSNCYKDHSTDSSPCADVGEGLAWEWCQRLHRASIEIAECPVTAKDLAAALRRSNSNQLTERLEKTRDFIAAVLAEAGLD
jgi:predicted RNA-binding Zn-ribbon protein involved in translation (DUF1610 family)